MQFEAIQQRLEKLAHQYQIWIVAGTLPCPFRPDGSVIDGWSCPYGQSYASALNVPKHVMTKFICLMYKLVMLWVDTKNRNFLSLEQMLWWQKHLSAILGLMVCYDLRFPELALTLRTHGANILTAPAAFTYTTGQMHWQLLLQARAMDSQ